MTRGTASLRLILPAGWVAFELADETRSRAAVRRYVAQLGGDGQGARLRRELLSALTERVRTARAAGASMLAMSGPAAPLLSGSILVTPLPGGPGVEGDEPWLGGDGRLDVGSVVAGRVVRRVARREVAMAQGGVSGLVVDYWLRSGAGQLVHLAMSSPLVEHEHAMTDLFDAVVEAARWGSEEA